MQPTSTPLPPLSMGGSDFAAFQRGEDRPPLGVFDMAVAGSTVRDAQVADLVNRWMAAEWTWSLDPSLRKTAPGSTTVQLETVSQFDSRIRHRFSFKHGDLLFQEIVCDDEARGVFLVVSIPQAANRDDHFDHAPLHRLADAMIGMGIEQPLGVAEKIAGDRISELRS
ncbi:hypothetical protein AFEL58S_01975 [Afipia felis]